MCNDTILNNGQPCPYEIQSGPDTGDCFRGKSQCPADLTEEELEAVDVLRQQEEIDIAEYKLENRRYHDE